MTHAPHMPGEPPRDGLDDLLAVVFAHPAASDAYFDAQDRSLVLRILCERRERTATQDEVARAMETAQSAVSDLENGRLDVRVAMLQRYARAVGSRVGFTVAGNSPPEARTDEAPGEPDDVDLLLQDVRADPRAAAAYEDAQARASLMAELLAGRKQLGMSQHEVSALMETSQSVVSALESGRTDPRLSAVQRYARAIGTSIVIEIDGVRLDEYKSTEALAHPGDVIAAAWGLEDVVRALLRFHNQPGVSRAQLVKQSRLSSYAAERTLQHLTSEGIVTPVENDDNELPAVRINQDAASFVGISIREHHVRGICTQLQPGAEPQVVALPLRDQSPTTVVDTIGELVSVLTGSTPITAVGVELSGPVNGETGTVLFAPDLQPLTEEAWTDYPLERKIQERLGGLVTIVSNDAKAIASYEHVLKGSADGLIVVNLSDSEKGIGAGLVFNGAVISGADGQSGELGHVMVNPHGALCTRCGSGRRGCLETEATPDAIKRQLDVATIEAAAALVDADDLAVQARARKVFERAGVLLGRVLGDVGTVLNPGRVAVYGPSVLVDDSATKAARLFTEAVGRGISETTLGKTSTPEFISIAPTTGPLAAAIAALDWLLAHPQRWPARPGSNLGLLQALIDREVAPRRGTRRATVLP